MRIIEEGFIGTALAEEGGPAQKPQSTGGPFGMFLPMILVFVIFYFLMIRPQARQRKRHQSMLQALKKGDEVVTAAGIHGRVTAIADNIATVEIAENVRIKVDKLQVAQVKTAPNPT
ncbi:MAG: preprotein translocase subunit YajC [Deltaproteobacteria bacterium]|nr:preprotein translocase subunit YajC [Deltaproteobacteria bacterium]MBI4373691.1 preprotein translocase subunit YajC [Deltaproteobacteria bacterium]